MLYWMDGKITPVFDEKRAPIYAFNATNVNENYSKSIRNFYSLYCKGYDFMDNLAYF